MHIQCNSGILIITQVGYFKGFVMVWYHPYGIANIIYIVNAKEKLRITCNSGNLNRSEIYKPDGTTSYFNQTPRGLYYLDTAIIPQEETYLFNMV